MMKFLNAFVLFVLCSGFTLSAQNSGELVINEFLASNMNGEMDEVGQREDWLELFNNTTVPLSLTGIYLTDDPSKPDKWLFPNGTSIPAQGFLIVWLDEDPTQGPLHTNFKLSAMGEFLMISNGTGGVIDSLTFGPQRTDTTYGRYPNGTGDFTFMPRTFNAVNSLVVHTGSPHSGDYIECLPNPVSDFVMLRASQPLGRVLVSDAQGRVWIRQEMNDTSLSVDVTQLPAGQYFLHVGSRVLRKITVIH